MDDYIKRSDAVHALCKAVHKDDGVIPCESQTASCLWSKTRVCDYAREIDALPSEDVVEVVRCKDCRLSEHDIGITEYWCCYWDNKTLENGYCSYGEQKV